MPDQADEKKPLQADAPVEFELGRWYKANCRECNATVIFPYNGYENIICPHCNTTAPPQNAALTNPPDAKLQFAAIGDHVEMEYRFNADAQMGIMMKRWSKLHRFGAFVERNVLGKHTVKHGTTKTFARWNVLLPKTSTNCYAPAFVITWGLVWSMAFLREAVVDDVWAVLAVSFGVLSVITMVVSQFVEPGYLPRGAPPAEGTEIEDETYELVKGVAVGCKWCYTCHLRRPPRASHCAQCDLCVLEFDHHCGVTGACIGKRNLPVFMVFLFCINMTALTAGIIVVKSYFRKEHWSVLERLAMLFTSAIVVVVLAGVGSQFVSYVFMTMDGSTLRERAKRMYHSAGRNPFDDGKAQNCKKLWRLPPPSLIRRSTTDDDPAVSI